MTTAFSRIVFESFTSFTLTTHTHTHTHTHTQPTTDGHSQSSESFLEALSSTKQTSSSHPLPEVTLTRITDYPGHTLPQSSPGSARRSSLSVSESSLTSEGGSPGHQDNLPPSSEPRKRILKKGHGPRKHKSSNRVRWNIPEEGGDGLSLLSFDSTSTASCVSSSSSYQLAREGVSEARRNWREFEEAPPPGSTGLTPTKPSLAPLREESDHTHSLSPRASHAQSPPTCPQQNSTGTSNDVGIGHRTSPLFYSAQLGSTIPHPTSTPLRRYSDSTTATEYPIDPNSTHSSVAPPPILRLDHSNLSELEASTVEDRAKCNLFAFPSSDTGGRGANRIPNPPTYSGYIPPEGRAHLCGGSDADDYDHLSPQSSLVTPSQLSPNTHPQTLSAAQRAGNVRFDFFPRPSKTRDKKGLSSPPPPDQPPRGPIQGGTTRHGDDDIDEALNDYPDSASSRSGSSDPQSPIPDPSVSTTRPLTKQYSAPGSLGNDRGVPPPIPPKLRRRKSESPSSNGPSVSGTGISSVPLGKFPHGGPPEFATGPAHLLEDRSSEEGREDALSSVSTATLVPSEPGDPHPPSMPNTTTQRTKPNQTGLLGAGVTMEPKMTRSSTWVHPELISPLSSSAPTRQSWDTQWKDSGTTSFAPRPPPLPYHQQPPSSTHHHKLPLTSIEENFHPERQSVITVSNSGSDSSLRGVSPPEKISQAPVVSTSKFDRFSNSKNQFNYPENSLSQPLPIRPLRATIAHSGGQNSTSNRGHSQAPRFQNPRASGGNVMSRNHRLYHSHRSGLAPPRPRQRGPGNFPLRPPQPPHWNHREGLKFQFSPDPLETPPGGEDMLAMTRSYSPPYYSRALSQDDPPLGGNFYPSGGPGGGRGLLPRPWIPSNDGASWSLSQNDLQSFVGHSDHKVPYVPRAPRNNYPRLLQGHTHKPRSLQGHAHQPHPPQMNAPQTLKKAHSMTAV